MKSLFTHVFVALAFSCCIVLSANAQKRIPYSAVPSPVKTSFSKVTPGAGATWHEARDNYLVSFYKNNRHHVWRYSKTGVLLIKMIPISADKLSDGAKRYIKEKYPTQYTAEVFQVIARDGKKWYEIELVSKYELDVLKLTPSGKYLSVHSRPRHSDVQLASVKATTQPVSSLKVSPTSTVKKLSPPPSKTAYASVSKPAPSKAVSAPIAAVQHDTHEYEDLEDDAWLERELEEDLLNVDLDEDLDVIDLDSDLDMDIDHLEEEDDFEGF